MLATIIIGSLCILEIYTILHRAYLSGVLEGYISLLIVVIVVACFCMTITGKPYMILFPIFYGFYKFLHNKSP